MTAEFLWINIPLMVLFFALMVGISMWIALKRPDRHPRHTRTVPAHLRDRTPVAAVPPGQRQASAYGEGWRRTPLSTGRK